MNTKNFLLIIFNTLLLLLASSPWAGIAIKSENHLKNTHTVLIDADDARIDNSESDSNYTLIKIPNVYYVDISKKIILDLSSPPLSRSAHGRDEISKSVIPDVKLKESNKGPMIQGFETIKYQVFLGQDHCFDQYLSKEILNQPGVKSFLQTMARASDSRDKVALAMQFNQAKPCDAAHSMVDDLYAEFGIPLRTDDIDGKTLNTVISIKKDQTFQPGTFKFPDQFQQLTREDMAKQERRLYEPSIPRPAEIIQKHPK